MRPSPSRATRRSAHGVALVIVLAFVLLLTGLILAFFSRAISERQISNSSAGQVKVDLFTQGAVATILGDLKQEIAAGSNATYYTDGSPNGALLGSVYLPVKPTTAVPALALQGGQQVVLSFPANLIKRSAYQQNFFPGSGDYNNNNTVSTVVEPTAPGATPAPSAAPTSLPSNRAANLSTTIASQNGRTISPARWNKALLLPKKSPLDSTDNTPYFADPGNPASTPAHSQSKVEFVPPDWVLVARGGTNPGSTSSTGSLVPVNFSGTGAVNNSSPSNQGFVVGRYAYTIYDEGGLLDANVAGYPTTTGKYPSANPAPTPPLQVIPQAKSALSYADLTISIPSDATDPASNPQLNLLTDAQVNSLVGWRNYASSKPVSGTFPTYVPAPTASPAASPIYSSFDISVLTNINGFMGVSNAPLYKNQSDRMFGSRQGLINFFTQGLPGSPPDTAALATLQNSLQYFGTFSRSLNQPSYAPVSRVSSTINPNPRPLIQPSAALGNQPGGGNNVGDNYPTAVQQDVFSPSFLSVRAEATFPRLDGSTAVLGEPLVKSRFALQRLAWLTYMGPSATRSSSDADMVLLINTYGITTDYLKRGTPENIQNYFGLTWDTTKKVWRYNVHNRGGASGAIKNLPEIADGHNSVNFEPDFFQLLKASVDPGSLAKASTNAWDPLNSDPQHVSPLNVQFKQDIALDAAIIQLGANIIDQFDVDGYSTRIIFDDSQGNPKEYRGIENLPYLYRVRTGGLKVREANPMYSLSSTTPRGSGTPVIHAMGIDPTTGRPYATPAGYTLEPLIDTGVGVLMAVPDIWNPHDQNSSMGTPRPTSFQIIANSASPDTVDGLIPGGVYSTFRVSAFEVAPFRGTSDQSAFKPSTSTFVPVAPAFSRTPTTSANATGVPMTNDYNNPHVVNPTSTTTLTFQVPDNTLFREPTLLARPDLTGPGNAAGPSKLTMTIPRNTTTADFTDLRTSSGAAAFFSSGVATGLKGVSQQPAVFNPLGTPTTPNALTQLFFGIHLGNYPLRWVGPRYPNSPTTTVAWVYTDAQLSSGGTPTPAMTYSVQYVDQYGAFATYDEKFVDTDTTFEDPYGGSSNQPASVLVQPKGGAFSFVDPRTSRFGSPIETNIAAPGSGGTSNHYRLPLNQDTNTWINESAGTVATERPGIEPGFGSNFRGNFSGSRDWSSYTAPGWHFKNVDIGTSVNAVFFQSGLLAQNDPYFSNNGLRYSGDTGGVGPADPVFYSDPDGVVRRGMGAYAAAGSVIGQPLATATRSFAGFVGTAGTQSQSRPIILNRPFRSVAEMGYVFSGIPWRNVDFSTPESGYSGMLDVFCVSDTNPSDGLVAGKVNVNTRQPMVLKSVLTGAYADEVYSTNSSTAGQPLNSVTAEEISKLLVQRTSTAPPSGTTYATYGPQPLQNIGDLVGRWNSKQMITGTFTPPLNGSHNLDGSKSYDGFSGDLTKLSDPAFNTMPIPPAELLKIARLRESTVRALANVGNTRVWNLMIDVIAQSGRYPATASSTKNFVVEGEERCWMHIAIDRYTGAVLDTKLEVVKE